MGMQDLLHMIYPPQCLTCDARVTTDFGLCGPCWAQTPFIAGLVCDQCGTPLQGDAEEQQALCDDCLTIARPWSQGRAALLYKDNARRMVLAFKHGDRLDLARPCGGLVAACGTALVAAQYAGGADSAALDAAFEAPL